LAQPIVFPGGPIGNMREREELLRKRAEELNLQHLIPKKRTRTKNTVSSKRSNEKPNNYNNNNNNIDNDDDNDDDVDNNDNNNSNNNSNKKNNNDNNTYKNAAKQRKEKGNKKRKYKNKNDTSSSSSDSNSIRSDDDACSDSEDIGDDALSEDEKEYDMSTLSDYIWLIGKVHQDSDDNKKYMTTRVEIDVNGFIVAYRQQVNTYNNLVGKESKNSYHIADIIKYTNSTQLANTSSTLSSSSQSSSSLSAEAISNSLKCEIIGCNEDQYDVCTIDCKKMLCAKHFNIHTELRSCHTAMVNIMTLL